MTKQLLIYNQVTPINKDKHGSWSIKRENNYHFCREVDVIPLMASEFPSSAKDYAIVFVNTEDSFLPVVILGVQSQKNLYLNDEGTWKVKYIPAFLRRYPFVFSSNQENNTLVLCLDEEFAGFNQEGRGERLFDSEGERTQYLSNMLDFLQEYQKQFEITKLFCQQLKELNLLEPMQANFSINGEEQKALTGFFGISQEKFRKLSGEQLEQLMKTGQLDLIYSHLQSMQNFSTLIEWSQVAGKQ